MEERVPVLKDMICGEEPKMPEKLIFSAEAF